MMKHWKSDCQSGGNVQCHTVSGFLSECLSPGYKNGSMQGQRRTPTLMTIEPDL